ncbi:MAG: WYL domain-containing protein [Leptospira sp.]|nr:WYL domain-containing protein [Leptospira sp.]
MPQKKIIPNTIAIETFALAREWIFKPYQARSEQVAIKARKGIEEKSIHSQDQKLPMKAGELYLFLDELHSANGRKNDTLSDDTEIFSRATKNETKTELTEKLRKRYEPYLKEFSKKYEIPVSFQDKYLDANYEEKPMTIIKICRDYLQDFVHSYSDEALELVVRNWQPNGDVLYFFVLCRYAIQRKVVLEFDYEKVMGGEKKRRRVIPYLIVILEYKLSLIAKDLRDGETKSFLISKIKNVQSDLRQIIISEPEDDAEEFDYTRFRKEDPNARFQKEKVVYEIEIAKQNLDFLRHTENILFKELEKSVSTKGWKVIQLETHRERDLFDLLFNYGKYARLVSPKNAVEKFKQELDELRDFYK